MYKCFICDREFKNLRGIISHIGRFHKNEITVEEYYLKFIGEKGKCVECGKDATFRSLSYGYSKFCSRKCSANSIETQNKMKETCLKNSGYEYSFQDPKIKEKKKQTCFEKTGYIHPMQDPKNKEKRKKTCFENSGYDYPMQDPKNKEKHKQTCLENSGYEYPSQDPKVKEKRKHTCLENSGYENPMQDPKNKEKSKQTNIKKRGYEYSSQDPKVKEKSKKSTLRNNNGIHHRKLTYKQVQEKYPDVVEIEGLIEGPNGEIWGHCKNSSCKNSKENGGYFDVSKLVNERNRGINKHDTGHFYCCQECKDTCPLYWKSPTQLHNFINENKEILYTAAEYSTWNEEVFYRQRIEYNIDYNFCEYCKSRENLQAHHIQPIKLEPGYALDPDNGVIFCEKCHYKIGHEKGTECSTGKLSNKICK